MLNTSDPAKALYPIEEQLRIRSLAGDGKCYVFAVYDICRLKAPALLKLAEDAKKQNQLDRQKMLAEQKQKSEEEKAGTTTEAGRGGTYTTDMQMHTNVFMVHGTVPNKAVAANSHLCEDL